VGFESADDAAVYRIVDDTAFISSADFITPPVDDPYIFGQIAAANALSDIYAMGGEPLCALNLVMFPVDLLGVDSLRAVLAGGNDKINEAGAVIAGGHSVDDREPKYGLSVTGRVATSDILRNSSAQSGDALVLTKPIGTGVLFNACRAKKIALQALSSTLDQIASLNATALRIAKNYELHGGTDITGFGLAGHVLEVARGSNVSIELFAGDVPVYPDAERMYAAGVSTGSNNANRALCRDAMTIAGNLSKAREELLFDPQTSGGLLLSLPKKEAGTLTKALNDGGVTAAIVGAVTGQVSDATVKIV